MTCTCRYIRIQKAYSWIVILFWKQKLPMPCVKWFWEACPMKNWTQSDSEYVDRLTPWYSIPTSSNALNLHIFSGLGIIRRLIRWQKVKIIVPSQVFPLVVNNHVYLSLLEITVEVSISHWDMIVTILSGYDWIILFGYTT